MEDIQVAPSSALDLLSFDDSLPYGEHPILPPVEPQPESVRPSLADRIGNTKVYLLADSAVSKLGKRKHTVEDEVQEDFTQDVDMEEDPTLRQNAILLHGSPISSLPTSNIFAYASHFDAHPIGLEWIDDNTCVLVFDSKAAAVTAHRRLQKSEEEEGDMDGFVTSEPIPVAIWPPEHRINKSLGKGEGLRGVIRMRWATKDDVKEKGARHKSQFYKKHGSSAGKDSQGADELQAQKRRRRNEESDEVIKAQLDEDIDTFQAGDDASLDRPSPQSKMRSDHMDSNGRSLLDRTSVIRLQPPNQLAARAFAELPRRYRDSQPSDRSNRRGRRRERGGGSAKTTERPHKSQQELDDELDAFLNEKD